MLHAINNHFYSDRFSFPEKQQNGGALRYSVHVEHDDYDEDHGDDGDDDEGDMMIVI